MAVRTTFTLDGQTLALLKHMGGTNRSAYINVLLTQERQRHLEQACRAIGRKRATRPIRRN